MFHQAFGRLEMSEETRQTQRLKTVRGNRIGQGRLGFNQCPHPFHPSGRGGLEDIQVTAPFCQQVGDSRLSVIGRQPHRR